MFKAKIYTVLFFMALSLNVNNTLYAADINADETETFTLMENKDLGIYIISKVVDSKTNNPIANAKIISEFQTVNSDKNGEFFIKVSPNGYINLVSEGYKDYQIKISDLKGKIKLELVPNYLPLFPNNSISVSYRNMGFSESFGNIVSNGRINDSFSLDGSVRLLNNLLLGAGYENLSGIYNRSQTLEKSSFSGHLGYLKANWIYSLLKDQIDLAFGVKTYYNTISITNTVTNFDEPRALDFLDYNNQRFAIGPDIEIATRPIKYIPFVLGASASYYPFITVSQDTNSPLPKNMNGFDYNIYARYDFMKAFVKTQFSARNNFSDKYNSGNSGLSLTLGYSF